MKTIDILLEVDVSEKESELFRKRLRKSQIFMSSGQTGGILRIEVKKGLYNSSQLEKILKTAAKGTGVFISEYQE